MHVGEVVHVCRCVWMLGAKRLFNYRQRALLKWSRACKVALFLEREGEAVEARRRFGMLGAERLFADRHCISKELHSLGVSRAPEEIPPCHAQKVSNVRSDIGVGIA